MDSGREADVRMHVLGDHAEIAVVDDVDIATEPAIERRIAQVVEGGALHIVLSFCGASFVGGPAVRLALIALDSVRPRGGSVIVRGDRRVRRLFEITGVPSGVKLEDC